MVFYDGYDGDDEYNADSDDDYGVYNADDSDSVFDGDC